MDLNKLSTFIEVARSGSITKTADQLYRTQSAITKQLQILEEELELILFDRRNARIFLTKEGQELYEFVEPRFQEVQDRIKQIQKNTKMIEGTIRLGILDGVSHSYLNQLILPFHQIYPKVRFQLTQGSDESIEEDLTQNRIDFGIHLLLKNRALFETIQISEERVILVSSKKYLDQVKVPKTVEEVIELDLIDYTPACGGLHAWLSTAAKELLPKLKRKTPEVIVADSILILDLVKGGWGIGTAPLFLIEKELASGELIHLLPKLAPKFTARLDVSIKKKRSKVLIFEEYLKFLREDFKYSSFSLFLSLLIIWSI